MGFEYYDLLLTEMRLLKDMMGSLLKPRRKPHISVFSFSSSQTLFCFGEVSFILFPNDLPLTQSHRATQRRKTTPVTVPCTGPFSNTAQRTFCHWHIGSHFVFRSRKMPVGQWLGGGICFSLASQLPLRRVLCPTGPPCEGAQVKMNIWVRQEEKCR